MEAPSKAFLLFFLLPDWLKLNHLRSWMECGFSDIFSRHICSTVAETMRMTNYAASFGANKCSENHIWSCWDDARSVEPTSCFKNLIPWKRPKINLWKTSFLTKFNATQTVLFWLRMLRCQNLSLLVHFRILKHFNYRTKGYCLVLCQTGLVFHRTPCTPYVYSTSVSAGAFCKLEYVGWRTRQWCTSDLIFSYL